MRWYVGVDGGGTKTDFAAAAEDGTVAATLKCSGCSYQVIGIEAAVALVVSGVRECLAKLDAVLADCAGCCLGMPCYGEDPVQDRALLDALEKAFAPVPIYLSNDVEVGWAGALECGEGIHLVAGTGSIAFGRGRDRCTARCGGWTEFFGDEGSCYWIGREAMSLFSKEADGRATRGPLYDIVRREFGLVDDFRFIDAVLRDIAPHRDRVAHFQRYSLMAAQAGDQAAAALYKGAASELALMAATLKGKLNLSPGTTPVSYSGGLFQAGKLILEPLSKQIESLDCILVEPKRSAVEGALILAMERFEEE